MAKQVKFRPRANPEWSSAMHAKRSSNAAQPYADARTKRARSRNASKKRDIRFASW